MKQGHQNYQATWRVAGALLFWKTNAFWGRVLAEETRVLRFYQGNYQPN